MEGVTPNYTPRTLFTFQSPEDIAQFVHGSDADIGGTSTSHFELGPDGKGRFWGDMRLAVKPGMERRIKGGYAGFRTRARPTLWGNMNEDGSLHDYLALRVRAGGAPETQNTYYVNIQLDDYIKSDLWQHRLFLRGHGDWEEILLPFRSFVLTSAGESVETEMRLDNPYNIRTVGISILGGKSNVQGPYELGIDKIWLTNEVPPSEPTTAEKESPLEKETAM